MHNHQHVTVIIPALNEERSITKVIQDIPDCVDRIIVVDNDSQDATAELAASAGAQVVREPQSGYGTACLAGIREVDDSEIIAFIGAGYSDYPQELIKIIEPVSNRDCDLAIGCRTDTTGEQKGRFVHQQFGTKLACWTIWLLHRVKFHDLGPMRCIRASVLNDLQMQDADFGWTTEMQLKAYHKGKTIQQISVHYRKRIGKSKISGTMKGSLLAGYKIFYWIFRLAIFKS